MKKKSELINLPIFSISEGKEYGKVKDLVIDAANGTAVALALETNESNWFYGTKLLPYELIVGIGESALVINKSSDILPATNWKEFEKFLESGVEVIGAKVLTKNGEIKGKVIEFSVDSSGKIQICEMEKTDGTTIDIPSKNIITFGKEVLFINELGDEKNTASPASAALDSEKKTDLIDKQPPAFESSAKKEIVTAPVSENKQNELVLPAAAVVEPISAGEEQQSPGPSAAKTDKIVPVLVPEIKQDTAAPEAAAANADDAAKTLEDKRRELLIGKKVAKRIETDNGVLIVDKNGVVTEEVLQKATLTNKLKELYINILK